MYGYIYKTTNLLNGKIYVGQHKAEKFEPDKYLGSGTIFLEALQKYGGESFKQELLETCETKEQLDLREQYGIILLKATDPSIGYNLTEGGSGGCTFRTEETKQKIGQGNKDKILINNGEHCLKINKADLSVYIALGYTTGCLPFTRTAEDKQRKSIAQTGRVAMRRGLDKTGVPKDQVDSFLAAGYTVGGSTKRDSQKKTIGETAPFKLMSNGTSCHKVSVDYGDEYLSNGGRFGNCADSRNKPVVCYETGEVFSSISDVLNTYPKASVLKRCLKLAPKTTCCGYHWYFLGDTARKNEIIKTIETGEDLDF